MLNTQNNNDKYTSQTLISYEGPFFIDLLTMFGNYLKMYTLNDLPAQKKLFKIYVELAQNVAFYSEDYYTLTNENKHIGIGELNLQEVNNQMRLTTRNMVKVKDANILSQRCSIINNTVIEELKELKRELRSSSPSYKYGARIGLVQAKILSRNNLEYSILEKNRDYSIFKITVKVDKNEKHRD
jgi:hypothetical protein